MIDPRVETWVLTEGPKPMVAQLRDWARLAHRSGQRVVLVEVGRSEMVSWPVFALAGRLAKILAAQQSVLALVVHENMRERCERLGLGDDDVPVFSDVHEALAWGEAWLDERRPDRAAG